MGRNTKVEQENELGENTLAALGTQKAYAKQRAKVVRLITGLQDASRIDVERAEFRVKKARAELRDAEDDLSQVKETNGHEAEALLELVQLSAKEDAALDEDMRQVASDLQSLGRTFIDPDLISPAGMVERQRRVREAGASKPEREVV